MQPPPEIYDLHQLTTEAMHVFDNFGLKIFVWSVSDIKRYMTDDIYQKLIMFNYQKEPDNLKRYAYVKYWFGQILNWPEIDIEDFDDETRNYYIYQIKKINDLLNNLIPSKKF